MTLQINYQPSAMLLGQMAQSAGESEYNRWLQGFNQQKAQSIANAFMGGFTQMGLPMAQMQSRENIMKQQIASRGQASAAKAMQNIEWKRNNLPLLRDMHADRMYSRYGQTWAEDNNLLHEWQQNVANMDAGDARQAVNKWMFHKNQDRTHGLNSSPSAQNALASGRYQDALIGSQIDPEYGKAIANIQKGPYKPEAKQSMVSSLNRQMAQRRNPAGRPATKHELYERDVLAEPITGTDLIQYSVRDPKTGKLSIEFKDKFEEDKKSLHNLWGHYNSLTSTKTDSYGAVIDEEDDDKRRRLDAASQVMEQIKFHSKRIYGENLGAGPENAETDSVKLSADVKRWNKRENSAGVTNESVYERQKKSGNIEAVMGYLKLDKESDIPDEHWTALGMTSPRPYKSPTAASEKEAETKRKTEAGLKTLQDPGGPPPPLDQQAAAVSQVGALHLPTGQKVDVRGKTPEELKGLLAAQKRGLENPDSYVFENGELRQMSKQELLFSKQQESVKLEGIVQQEAAVEEQQAAQAIADQGAKEAFDMLHPDWKSGQPAPVGWVKKQSSGTRGEGGPPVREWIVPTGRLMETFKELKGLNQSKMLGKYSKQIHEEKKTVKSTQGKQSLERLNTLWKDYVKNMWEDPSRGMPAKDQERDLLLRKGSAAAVWLSYMEKDPDNVIDKFLEFVKNPEGKAIPADIREIADAYRVLAQAGVFNVMKPEPDPHTRIFDPGAPGP